MFGRRMEVENSTLPNPVAPTYLISDYIEIAYLGLVLLFGVPANVIILQKLVKEMKMSNRDMVKVKDHCPSVSVIAISEWFCHAQD